MPTLNRFPLLGLWAREAARRLGYRKDEAEALGHAYAVLYAIRAQGHKKPKKAKPKPSAPATAPPAVPAEEELEFCGDNLPIQRDANDHIQGLVGHEELQTARSYQTHIARKFPPGYYEKLEDAFRTLLKTIPPRELRADHRLYQIYDQWKKSCGVGRLVDLDRLLEWCEERRASTS
jgi:hypothetical protein